MHRLIRAEWYRLLHSGIYLRSILLCCIFLSLLPLITDFSLLHKSLAENMGTLSSGCVMMVLTVSMIISIFVANGYMKKTAYYEVMAGNKSFRIIGSKLFVDGFLPGVICFFAVIWPGVLVAAKNGIGAVEELPLRLLLLFVICLRVTCLAVLVGLAVKHLVAAGLVIYVRFLLFDLILAEILPMLLVRWKIEETFCLKVQRCMVIRQVAEVFGPEIVSETVMATIGGFLAELLLWYGITYVTMKKKWYK